MEAVAGRPELCARDGTKPVVATGEAFAERDQAEANREADTRGGTGAPVLSGRRARSAIRALLEIGLVGVDQDFEIEG
jgi:hypothetical protein